MVSRRPPRRVRGHERDEDGLLARLDDETVASPHALARRDRLVTTLLDALPDLAFLKDHAGIYRQCNQQMAALIGRPAEDVPGRTDHDLFPPEVAARYLAEDELVVQRGAAVTFEEWVTDPDGRRVLLETVKTPVTDVDGEHLGIIGISRDVTARRRDAELLEAEQLRLEDALDAARAASWEWDIPTDDLRVGHRWLRLLGEEVDGDGWVDGVEWGPRLHPEDRPHVTASLQQLVSGTSQHHDVEYRVRHHDGHWLQVRDVGRIAVRDDHGRPLLARGLMFDRTEETASQQELAFAAAHDGLTGLINRQHFCDRLRPRLEEAAATGRSLAVFCLDLDGFAGLNQAYGRAAGNQLLVELAARLLQDVGDRDGVARIGGDEFALLVPLDDTSWKDAADRLSELVSRPLRLQGRTLQTTASVGVTLSSQEHSADADQLLRQADQAVYQAKLAGKDRTHLFDTAIDDTRRERFRLIEQVHRALVQREFVLHYQPKVHLRTGEVLGFEALIRWQHPSGELLPPGVFIPQLVGHPLSIRIGDWVIEESLAQLARWKTQGLHTAVSVNADTAQLYDPDFTDRLQRQLAAEPTVAPDQLGIEILETGALEQLDVAAAVVDRLRRIGAEVALDDFGTGFSSLTLLKHLDAGTIKIDSSFVLGLLDDPEHALIIESIVALTRSFRRAVLAEGVETDAQGEALLELGCELGQGFGIARPMPAAEVIGWCSSWQPPQAWRGARGHPGT